MKTLRMPQKHLRWCQLWEDALRYLTLNLVNKKSKTKTQIKHRVTEWQWVHLFPYTFIYYGIFWVHHKSQEKPVQSKDAALQLYRSYLHHAFRDGTHGIEQKQQLVISGSFVKSGWLQHCKCQKEPDPPSHLTTHVRKQILLHLWSRV